jgi:hypothetical protein
MSIEERILEKRRDLQELKTNEEGLRQELHALFTERAASICPIAVGTKVEYEPGRYGQVDRIEYHVDFWNELNPRVEVHWAVTGRKINKTGEFGVKDFSPVGPATHFVTGTSFKHKGLAGFFPNFPC